MMLHDTVYHFVGIKGSGMSALALILHGKGCQVQGSDQAQYFFTQQELENQNIPLLDFDEENIQPDLTIIAGNAYNDENNIELARAKQLNLPVIRYDQFLGQLMEDYISIAVTGSHGKTSTTGLLAHTLKELAPTSYLIGDGTGVGLEDATYFAMEACEYKRHFLSYKPDYAIVTNVDFDHPDYYQSIEDVFDAFSDFADQAKKGIIACGEDEYLRQLKTDIPVYFYGFSKECDTYVSNIERTVDGSSFDVTFQSKKLGRFQIPTYGRHNILNALSVITLLCLEGFEPLEIANHLTTYTGVKRRFSIKNIDDLIVIDDYAHHPVEIKATIDAAKQKFPDRSVIAIFQPHTFSRTVALLDEFAEALNLADEIYLADIFHSAREASGEVRIEDLHQKVKGHHDLISRDHLSPLMNYEDAVLLFMGAGDIDKISEQFSEAYSRLNKIQL